nr:MAG TPA: hypothetical protein [Caudoviricetes sp.]
MGFEPMTHSLEVFLHFVSYRFIHQIFIITF